MKQKDEYLIELFYNEALQTQKGIIRFGDFNPKSLSYFGKVKAIHAVNYFQDVLDEEPYDFRLFFS